MAASIAIAADAAVKLATIRWLDDSPVDLGMVTLRSARNSGIAFGIAAELPSTVVIALTTGVVAVLAVATWKRWLPSAAGAGLIVGGGLANLADRLLGGAVIDTFDLGWWPVFNMADIAITTGVLLTLLRSANADANTR